MTKRINPFSEDYIPQNKVHVGVKQFNNNENRLQKVYEKTLDLLYKGAKKQNINDDASIVPTPCKDKMKQLFIGKNGNLLHTGSVVQNRTISKECVCSKTANGQCTYCEKAVCEECRRLCVLCDQVYCAGCSLTGLEGTDICVSCYK